VEISRAVGSRMEVPREAGGSSGTAPGTRNDRRLSCAPSGDPSSPLRRRSGEERSTFATRADPSWVGRFLLGPRRSQHDERRPPGGRSPFACGRDGRAGKPNSVYPCRDRWTSGSRGVRHLSGTTVTGRLKRPTCTDCSAGPLSRHRGRNGATWPCTPWGLPGRSGRPKRRCALTAPFHPLPRTHSGRDCSLLHVPSCRPGRHAFPLGSTEPCSVRTFLTADPDGVGTDGATHRPVRLSVNGPVRSRVLRNKGRI